MSNKYSSFELAIHRNPEKSGEKYPYIKKKKKKTCFGEHKK